MSDNYLKQLIEEVTEDMNESIKNSNSTKSNMTTSCKYCPDGLVINGFCYNCGSDGTNYE